MNVKKTSVEELIEVVTDYVVAHGPCGAVEEEEEGPYCEHTDCAYCRMARALDHYTNYA